jgi:hypothetical protein
MIVEETEMMEPTYAGLRVLRESLPGGFSLPDFRVNLFDKAQLVETQLDFCPERWMPADLDALAAKDPFGVAVNVALLSSNARFGIAFIERCCPNNPFRCPLLDGLDQGLVAIPQTFVSVDVCGTNEHFLREERKIHDELHRIARWGRINPGLRERLWFFMKNPEKYHFGPPSAPSLAA